MIDETKDKNFKLDTEELNNICDECKEEDESVTQNLILTGFKLCKSCRLSKTILISLAPQIIFLLYIFSIFQTNNINFS